MASLTDKVVSEVCSAIESSTDYNLQLYALQSGGMEQLQSPLVTLLYGRLSNSASTQQRILGLSGLIRRGSNTALVAAAQAASTFGTYKIENGILLQSIRGNFRAADATSITTLGKSALDPNTPAPFREAVAHALAAIHSVGALPFLASLLDDADANLRVEAVGGISSFANGLPAQTPAGSPSLAHLQLPADAPYRTAGTLANFAVGYETVERNEASYVSFWRQWWSGNRAALGF